MRRPFVRLTSLFLLLAAMTAAVFSCAEAPEDKPTETLPPKETDAETRITHDLPPKTFDGCTFNMLHWTEFDVHATDLYVEESDGDLIADAVFHRNSRLENELDITFELEEYSPAEVANKVRTAIRSNEDFYDITFLTMASVAPVMLEGSFLDFEQEMPYVDLDKPYYDQSLRNQLSFAQRLYLVGSDMSITDKSATASIIFNKDLARDYDMPDFYTAVRNGEWTLFSFLDAMTCFDGDLNGDGKMNPADDCYGYIASQDTTLTFFYSAGGRLTEKDEFDLPFSCFSEDDHYDILTAVFDIIYDPMMLSKANGGFINNETKTEYFIGQHGLFFWQRMVHIIRMRGEEAINFGILPPPKYDEMQEDYPALISKRYTGLMSVLSVETDPETVSYIIEAMAAGSHYGLQEAYYDATLKTKSARDDESQDMLDIIFAHRAIDIGEVCDFGGFATKLAEFPFTSSPYNYGIMSTYASVESKIEDDIYSFLDQIETMEQYR